MSDRSSFSRRLFVKQLAFASAAFSTPGLMAEQLTPTPQMGEGPFYPDKLPLDTDNDLLILNDALTPAVGQITHLSGRVLSSTGQPVRNAFVEIWQVDNNGAYLHTKDPRTKQRDSNFQSYGRFLTDIKGQYYFRTIKPVPYPGRTPHIHIAVSTNGRRIFTSQILIAGHEQNEGDGLFKRIPTPELRKLVLADFVPIEGSPLNELSVNFDVITGVTPEDRHESEIKGGIGKPLWSARSQTSQRQSPQRQNPQRQSPRN